MPPGRRQRSSGRPAPAGRRSPAPEPRRRLVLRERPTDRRRAALRRRLWSPPAHWRLLAFCLMVVLALMAIQGYVTHTIGPSAEPGAAQSHAAPLAGQNPLFIARGDRLISVGRAPGKEIALTFDDGPSPQWTPPILSYLHSQRVPATFFVIGSQAVQHRKLIHREVAEGFDIGDHTLTHTALSNGAMWTRKLQLDMTESILVGLTGRYHRLMRPPYSATSDAVTPDDEGNLARLTAGHYIVALANYDSEDWQRPGLRRILANATPAHGQGGIIMFHDGGGNRSETLAALQAFVPRMRAAGYRFVSVPSLLAPTPGARTQASSAAGAASGRSLTQPVASAWARTRAWVFTTALWLAFLLTGALQWIVLIVGALVSLRFVLLLALASRHRSAKKRRRPAVADELHLPRVAVVVPAFNEEVNIERAARSLAASDYPDFEVIVVDDCSTYATATLVEPLADELPCLRLLRKPNGGKPSALNAGWRDTDAEIIVMVDGDTLFEADTITRLVQPLRDPRVGAVSGNTKVGNRGGLLGAWQHVEYVMGFNLDRRMYEVLQCTPTVPGAVGAFRRTVLEQIGGVPSDTLAEDTDLTLTIGRSGHLVMYADDARAWTEAPSTLSGLWRQRYRWSYGTMQAVWKHKGAMLSRDHSQKRIGRRALPYMIFFQILLPTVAPLIDIFALYGLLFADSAHVLEVWLLFNVLQLALGAFAFRLDRERSRALWALPLQQFVYRQLMYLVIIESTISALVGMRAHWQHIERTGDIHVEANLSAADDLAVHL